MASYCPSTYTTDWLHYYKVFSSALSVFIDRVPMMALWTSSLLHFYFDRFVTKTLWIFSLEAKCVKLICKSIAYATDRKDNQLSVRLSFFAFQLDPVWYLKSGHNYWENTNLKILAMSKFFIIDVSKNARNHYIMFAPDDLSDIYSYLGLWYKIN